MDILTLNVLIESLINATVEKDQWLETARAVVEYCHNNIPLQDNNAVRYKITTRTIRGGQTMRGFTPEMGNVDIPDRDDSTTDDSEEDGTARVGNYKIAHMANGNLGLIWMHHFWKAEIDTQGINDPEAQTILLAYNIPDIAPICIAEPVRNRIWWIHLGPFKLDRYYAGYQVIYGTATLVGAKAFSFQFQF